MVVLAGRLPWWWKIPASSCKNHQIAGDAGLEGRNGCLTLLPEEVLRLKLGPWMHAKMYKVVLAENNLLP